MADQRRWFKVWTSIVANGRFAEMPLEDIGRWVLLGAATALDGDRGGLHVPGSGRELCRVLRVPDLNAAKEVLQRLSSVTFEEGKKHDGEHSVTWKNWQKYQEDSTAAQRMKTLRLKRRGEEKRGDEKRKEEKRPPLSPPCTVDSLTAELTPHEAYKTLDVRAAILRCESWCRTNAKRLTRTRVVNWLNRDAADSVTGNGRPTARSRINDAWKGQPTGDVKL